MITFPPQMRNGGPEEMAYRAVAQQCMYRMNMARGQLSMMTQRFILNNGTEIICRHCFGKEDVWVTLPPVVTNVVPEVVSEQTYHVFVHPRSGEVELLPYSEWQSAFGMVFSQQHRRLLGVAGGWRDGITALVGEYLYPLMDEDNASYAVSRRGDELSGEFAGANGNYGNLCWWNGDEEEPVFLSWKGTPTRHFRLPSNIEINGFSVQETEQILAIENMPVFTAFGTKIYQAGSAIATAPKWNWPSTGQPYCLILGTALHNDALHIVTQSDRLRVPKFVSIFSDGYRIESDGPTARDTYLAGHSGVSVVFEKEYPTVGGIYTMLWKQSGPVDGWSFIGEYNTGRQGLPWFATADGSYFTSTLGYKFLVTGEYSEIDTNSSGTYTSTEFACGDMQVTSTYSSKKFFEGDKFGSVSLAFKSQSSKVFPDALSKEYTGSFPILVDPDGPDMPVPMRYEHSIYATQQAVVGQFFRSGIVGGDGDITETYSGFSVNEDGIITSVNGCGSGSVTATDACGDTYTRPVMLTSGMWLLASDTFYEPIDWSWLDTSLSDIREGVYIHEYAVLSAGPTQNVPIKRCASSPNGNICIDDFYTLHTGGSDGTEPELDFDDSFDPTVIVSSYNPCSTSIECNPPSATVTITDAYTIRYVLTRKLIYSWVCP